MNIVVGLKFGLAPSLLRCLTNDITAVEKKKKVKALVRGIHYCDMKLQPV